MLTEYQWNTEAILEEYKGFAAPKVRDCDVEYITNYHVATLEGLFIKKIPPRAPVLTNNRMAKLFTVVLVVLSIWVTTLLFW
jgi:tyrosine-protein phosphatase SIW14